MHELEITDGQAHMAYVGEKPWHNLGVELKPGATPTEMLEASRNNWRVFKAPLFAEYVQPGQNGDADVTHRVKTKAEALIRETDGKIMTVVTDSWTPFQNQQAFDFFNEFVEAGKMSMETGGALKDGQIVWALARINETAEPVPGDVIQPYLLFSNPHIFGKSMLLQFTATRVVCQNTMQAALNGPTKGLIRVSHRKTFDAELVKETLGLSHSKLSAFKEKAEFLASKRYTQEMVVGFFNDVFPKTTDHKPEGLILPFSRSGKRAYELLDTQPGAEYAQGSWWTALNAVTRLIDHEIGRSVDSRLYSAWFGTNRDKKIAAMDTAIEYARAA
jgi:phage/plasmid-like protein (TIGR03299 family)